MGEGKCWGGEVLGRGSVGGGEVLGEGKCSFGVTAIRNKKTGKYPAQRTFQSKTKTLKMK